MARILSRVRASAKPGAIHTTIFIEIIGIIFSISLLAMMGSTLFETWLPRTIGIDGAEAS
ncbi:hypothetical protein [Pseudomonas aeruginosa]|uniref:hypothetical protein n=1 Tax=Pseudomonas aeruginosa TaxID=287 RepID=UPI000EB5F671|nr:hypothetical protein [Pseudomonas aeruginosa]